MKNQPLIFACAASLLSASGLAGELSWETEASFSAVADSTFRARMFRDDVSEVNFGFRAVASTQFGGGPLFRAGVEWERYDFRAPARAPLPDTLQSFAIVLGADFQLGEAWLFRLEASPGFYSGGADFRAADFNVPVIFGGSYFVSADLQFVGGIEVDVNRKYPVLGAVGLRWKFAPGFVLNAVLPNPRLEYTFSKSLTAYLGGDLRETTYRMDSTFGRSRGRRKLDNSIVDYTEIRVGAGATWNVTSHLTLEGEAGVVPVHDFDYHRADVGVRTSSVPAYGGVSLKAAF